MYYTYYICIKKSAIFFRQYIFTQTQEYLIGSIEKIAFNLVLMCIKQGIYTYINNHLNINYSNKYAKMTIVK